MPRGRLATGDSDSEPTEWSAGKAQRDTSPSLKSANKDMRARREGVGSDRAQPESWLLLLFLPMRRISLDPRHVLKC